MTLTHSHSHKLSMARRKLGSQIRLIGDGAAEVELTQGLVAIIDQEDIPLVAPHKWHVARGNKDLCYARCNGDRKAVPMHRLLFGDIPADVQVDHIDRNGLNNRRSNLRLSNATFQKLNQSVRRDCTSGCTGVHLRPDGKWQARISVNGRRVSLGHFATFNDAQFCMESVRSIVDELMLQLPTVAKVLEREAS